MTALADRLEACVGGRTVTVVGIGNRLRGDDAAGSLVIERLGGAGGARALDAELTPENYLGPLLERGQEVVLFVDAADLGAAPGTCRVAAMDELAPRAESTHAPSLRLTADLLAAYGVASLLLGIQPGRTSPGERLTPAVDAAVDAAAAAIARLLGREVRRG
jgi:hydrogenase maturation protease